MKKTFCKIRKDLLEKELSIPVGESFVGTKERFEYRWVDDEQFQIFYEGIWQDAESIDFEF